MCCAGRQQDATTELEDNMGYKILDVKADIHEDVERMFETLKGEVVPSVFTNEFAETLSEDICDIVDKHFEKIER